MKMKIIPGKVHLSLSTKYRGTGRLRGVTKGPNWFRVRWNALSMVVSWDNGHWHPKDAVTKRRA
jgi:hypothetical protein